MTLSRRLFLVSALAGATVTVAGPVASDTAPTPTFSLAPPPPPLPPLPPAELSLRDLAQAELNRLGDAIALRDVVGLADFASPSRAPRFHLVDMASGAVTSLLVAHGSGSDPAHTGWLRQFSNMPGSNASSEGAFRTGEYYVGKHGRSMRLIGLDPANSQAEARAIVVHGASYVSQAMAAAAGRIGRSQGCFAFAEADLPRVLERLGPGRLLLSTKL